MPPPRVRLRIFEHYNGTCYRSGIKIMPGMQWQLDHVIAIINGGENREQNLAPILIDKHKEKSAEDLAIKSKIAATAKYQQGIKSAPRSKIQSRGFPQSEKAAKRGVDKLPMPAPRSMFGERE
jgi:hypothetical protein